MEEIIREESSDSKLIEERKRKFKEFFARKDIWVYLVLVLLVIFAFWLRTLNTPLLKDITNGEWTLGPDLDPFLFLRWAEYIVENGKIMEHDAMRYVPLGYDTKFELLLTPYLIALFHKIFAIFNLTDSVAQSAIYYPVVMFMLTIIAFFLFVRTLFLRFTDEKRANIIALIASFFLSVSSSLLPRTIAGIPEKESSAFFFMFLTFYFFIKSWYCTDKKRVIFSLAAAISTACMALTWGGYGYLFLTLVPLVFLEFIFDKIDNKKIQSYAVWLIASFALMSPFSSRYSIENLLFSFQTGAALFLLFIMSFDSLLFKTKIKDKVEKYNTKKIPHQILSIIASLIIGFIIILILKDFNFLLHLAGDLKTNIFGEQEGRLIKTVAENRQPFFNEWSSSFGPFVKRIPIMFLLLFIGTIYLFYNFVSYLEKKDKILFTASFFVLITTMIFNRYSSSSILNGSSSTSIIFYVFGMAQFLIFCIKYYIKLKKTQDENKFSAFNFEILLLLILTLLSILSAKNSVRLIMVLAPSVSIIASYLFVEVSYKSIKNESNKLFMQIIAILLLISILFSGYAYFKESKNMAKYYGPNIYTHQWQKAMAWVRENTPQNAVFGHWWDYGYWLQSIGKRASVLDGGNAIGYWNYLMGRYGLTGPDTHEALNFLYAHNTTHFLIDSTDIGKYGAFSSIGSNENYDRSSYIPSLSKDITQTKETKNGTQYVYLGGFGLDEDIIYQQNESKILLPSGRAGVAGVLVELTNEGKIAKQPQAVFIDQNAQYIIPLRYAYFDKLNDYGTGIEAGVFIMPKLFSGQQGQQFDPTGAMLYLSKRTVKSQLARLYLYNENNPYFKLVHSEDDFLVAEIKASGNSNSSFVDYNGFRGPIRIWEINYPKGMQVNQTYLQREFIKPELDIGR